MKPRQALGGGVPLPTALTASVVLGMEQVSTGDLKRCPQDRPASGRSWQLRRPGLEAKASVQMKPAPRLTTGAQANQALSLRSQGRSFL